MTRITVCLESINVHKEFFLLVLPITISVVFGDDDLFSRPDFWPSVRRTIFLVHYIKRDVGSGLKIRMSLLKTSG